MVSLHTQLPGRLQLIDPVLSLIAQLLVLVIIVVCADDAGSDTSVTLNPTPLAGHHSACKAAL